MVLLSWESRHGGSCVCGCVCVCEADGWSEASKAEVALRQRCLRCRWVFKAPEKELRSADPGKVEVMGAVGRLQEWCAADRQSVGGVATLRVRRRAERLPGYLAPHSGVAQSRKYACRSPPTCLAVAI